MKDLAVDELSSKVFTLERENKILLKDMESVALLTSRIEEAEKENRDLIQKAAIDKKTLATLREVNANILYFPVVTKLFNLYLMSDNFFRIWLMKK